MVGIINDYLDESTLLNKKDVSIHLQNSNPTRMRQTIFDKVTHGIPVVVDARNYNNLELDEEHSAHSFIAYDYDKQNDEIYCNAGRHIENNSHISMSDIGFTYIQEIMYIEPKFEHTHSFNYCINDKDNNITELCACSSIIPSTISIHDNYLDIIPTFKWNSLIKERWSKKDNLHHSISVLKNDKTKVFQINNIFDNKYALTRLEWKRIINDIANPFFYIYITIDSQTYPYRDDYYCMQQFREPNRYILKSSFLPQDWKISARYYFENELDNVHVSNESARKYTIVSQNDLTINTERLRTGYIENSYLVFSPRRQNAGRAYFEMNFDKPVFSFMYRACMWSQSENLDGIAVMQSKNSAGHWSTLKDIPISELSEKEIGLKQFVEILDKEIYGLRFETTSAATGNRNKGRLCLGDFAFCTKIDHNMFQYVDYDYIL